MTVEFTLCGLKFVALNGGPQLSFSEAISSQIPCTDQAEVDRYRDALSEGGEEGPCGWLKDRYGLSWQVVPKPAPRAASQSRPGDGRAGDAGDEVDWSRDAVGTQRHTMVMNADALTPPPTAESGNRPRP
jgi:hypothetical protein